MTDITQHVPDLETCKMLKEAGFPPSTYFFWTNIGDNNWRIYKSKESFDLTYCEKDGETIAAPLASEILEKMPPQIKNIIELFQCLTGYETYITGKSQPLSYHENPATACAMMWLKLREEGKL